MLDEAGFFQQFLDAPNTREVLAWLRESSADDLRWLGETGSDEASIALAQEIYDAGAVEVLAVDIHKDPGEQSTGRLVIKLPETRNDRERVFAWAGAMAQSQGFEPDEDEGQTYLFVMLD
jgi:hypothetical protein